MKRFLVVLFSFWFLIAGQAAFAGFTELDPRFQIKGTKFGAGENFVSDIGTYTLTNKTIDGDTNTIQDLGLNALKTVAEEMNKFIHFGADGNATATKAVPTGAVVGDADSQELTNKTIDSASNTMSVAISAIKSDMANLGKFLTFGPAGEPLATKTAPSGEVVGDTDVATLTNKHISGDQIDSGTIPDAQISSDISRDSEVTEAINSHKTVASGVHGLPDAIINGKFLHTNAETGVYEWADSSGISYKRSEAIITGTATSTVTFVMDVGSMPTSIGTWTKCKVYMNGVLQAYANFTKTSGTVIESSQGDIPVDTLVTVECYE